MTILTLPTNLQERLTHPQIAPFNAESKRLATNLPTQLSALRAQPIHADTRNNAGIALSEAAFQAVLVPERKAQAVADLLEYTRLVTPEVFVAKGPNGVAYPEWGAIGPCLAYDLLEPFPEAPQFVDWARACLDLWWPTLLTQDFALKPETPHRRYGNWSGIFISGAYLLSRTVQDVEKSTATAAALCDYHAWGFSGNHFTMSPKETAPHYWTMGLAHAVYAIQNWFAPSDWLGLTEYLRAASYTDLETEGVKLPALGDTNTMEPGLPDFFYWLGGDAARWYAKTPSAIPLRPMSACLWRPIL